jgi:hypothetical protein
VARSHKSNTDDGGHTVTDNDNPIAGRISELAYAAPAGLDFARWAADLTLLCQLGSRSPWLIGDAILAGENLFGHEASAALDGDLGLHPRTLCQYARVAGRVGPDERVAGLTYSHHRAVSHLEKPERVRWLKAAVENGWSHRQLIEAVNGAAGEERETCPACDRPLPRRGAR